MRAGDLLLDDDTALEVARAAVGLEVLRVQILRTLSMRDAGMSSDAATSIDKLLLTWVEQDLAHTVLDALGAAALVPGAGGGPSQLATGAWRDYLWSRAASIYGGTEQVQRTIVATRLLDLPRG